MTKQTYRLQRRHGQWPAGAEVQLTEEEAQALDNEAPGIITGIVKAEDAPKAERETLAKPRVKDEETSK